MCHVIEAQLRITSVRGNTEKGRAGRNGKSSFREKRKLKHSENKKKNKNKKNYIPFSAHCGPRWPGRQFSDPWSTARNAPARNHAMSPAYS